MSGFEFGKEKPWLKGSTDFEEDLDNKHKRYAAIITKQKPVEVLPPAVPVPIEKKPAAVPVKKDPLPGTSAIQFIGEPGPISKAIEKPGMDKKIKLSYGGRNAGRSYLRQQDKEFQEFKKEIEVRNQHVCAAIIGYYRNGMALDVMIHIAGQSYEYCKTTIINYLKTNNEDYGNI